MQKTLKKYFVVFTVPTLIAFAFAFIIPFAQGLYLSFCKFSTVENAEWVGFDNYIRAFTDNKDFFNALLLTCLFTVIAMITINVLAKTFLVLSFLGKRFDHTSEKPMAAS